MKKGPAGYGFRSTKKTRDEDLVLFREMFKRESERNSNLLLEVSEDFEPSHGNQSIYKLPAGKKDAGNEFLGAEKDKNDYDWLKTPPATPLFPSLEMEACNPDMIFHRDLPVMHNFQTSRFLNEMEEPKFKQRPKSPFKMEEPKFKQRPKSPSSRSSTSSSSRPETPGTRPASSTGDPTSLRGLLNLPERPKKLSASTVAKRPVSSTTTPKSMRSTTPSASTAKAGSRGTSPGIRPRISATLPGFPDVAPPNLITSVAAAQARSKSSTRGRTTAADSANSRRQSHSPIFSRGNHTTAVDSSLGNGGVVMGSRMVQKMMNARRSPVMEERKPNPNPNSERQDIGKLMSRTSLNMALKQMDISKNTGGTKNSTNTSSASSNRTRTAGGPGNRVSSQAGVGSAGRFGSRSTGETRAGAKTGESKFRL